MKTPIEKMIEVVEKGYYSNEILWNEWKETLLKEERELLQHNVSNNEVAVSNNEVAVCNNEVAVCSCSHSETTRRAIAGFKCGICNGVIQ